MSSRLRTFRKAEADLESGRVSLDAFLAVVDEILESTGSAITVEAFKAAAGRPVHMYKRACLGWLKSLERIDPATWAREDAGRMVLLCRARDLARKHEDDHPHVHCYEHQGRAFVVVEWLARSGRVEVRVLSHEELPTREADHE